MLDPKTTTVIVNPKARAGEVGRDWSALKERLIRHLGACRFELTRHAGHAELLAEDAVRRGATSILSLGGDGTHGAVVHGMLTADADPERVSFGPLPAGTGGDFCRMIIGERELEATARALYDAEPVTIDAGMTTYVTDDGVSESRYFLNMASCGANGLVDRMVNSSSKVLGGKISFLAAITRALFVYVPARVRIELDGRPLGEHLIDSVCACNGRFAGGGILFAPNARLTDGMLDVVVIPRQPLLEQALRMPRMYEGTYIGAEPYDDAIPEVFSDRGVELVITPVTEAPAWVDIDGEAPGMAPMTVRALPGALSVRGLKPGFL